MKPSLLHGQTAGNSLFLSGVAGIERLAIIDPRVTDLPSLLAGLAADVVAIVLDVQRDGTEQIGEILAATGPQLRELHLVGHGRPGAIALGSGWLEGKDLLKALHPPKGVLGPLAGKGLNPSHDPVPLQLLLYGCESGKGAIGKFLVEMLAAATGAVVAASSAIVGAAALGGRWGLDVVAGGALTAEWAWGVGDRLAYGGVFIECFPNRFYASAVLDGDGKQDDLVAIDLTPNDITGNPPANITRVGNLSIPTNALARQPGSNVLTYTEAALTASILNFDAKTLQNSSPIATSVTFTDRPARAAYDRQGRLYVMHNTTGEQATIVRYNADGTTNAIFRIVDPTPVAGTVTAADKTTITLDTTYTGNSVNSQPNAGDIAFDPNPGVDTLYITTGPGGPSTGISTGNRVYKVDNLASAPSSPTTQTFQASALTFYRDGFPNAGNSSTRLTTTGSAFGVDGNLYAAGRIDNIPGFTTGFTPNFRPIISQVSRTTGKNIPGTQLVLRYKDPVTGIVRDQPVGDLGTLPVETPTVDLELEKTDGLDAVAPGSAITYTINARNTGGCDITAPFGISVKDTPQTSNYKVVSWSASPASSATPSSNPPIPLQSVLAPLASGATTTFSIQAQVDINATGVISNMVEVELPDGVLDPDRPGTKLGPQTYRRVDQTIINRQPVANNATQVIPPSNLSQTISITTLTNATDADTAGQPMGLTKIDKDTTDGNDPLQITVPPGYQNWNSYQIQTLPSAGTLTYTKADGSKANVAVGTKLLPNELTTLTWSTSPPSAPTYPLVSPQSLDFTYKAIYRDADNNETDAPATNFTGTVNVVRPGDIKEYKITSLPIVGTLYYDADNDGPEAGEEVNTATTIVRGDQLSLLKYVTPAGDGALPTGLGFFYTAVDGANASNSTSVPAFVSLIDGPNQPPVVQSLSKKADSATPTKILGAAPGTENDPNGNPNGQIENYIIKTLPPAGSGALVYDDDNNAGTPDVPIPANGVIPPNLITTLKFQPAAGFTSPVSFTYVAVDKSGLPASNTSDPGTVQLIPNTPPTVQNVTSKVAAGATVDPDIPQGTDNEDPGNIPDFYTITALPANGKLVLNGVDVTNLAQVANLTYAQLQNQLTFVAPGAGFTGASFTYTATDKGGLKSSPATVQINPDPPDNQPPRVDNLVKQVNGITQVFATVPGTDPDTPGGNNAVLDKYVITTFPPASAGSLVYDNDGNPATPDVAVPGNGEVPASLITSLKFQPLPGFTSSVDFKYVAIDKSGSPATNTSPVGTVTLIPNTPPVAQNSTGKLPDNYVPGTAFDPDIPEGSDNEDPGNRPDFYTIRTLPPSGTLFLNGVKVTDLSQVTKLTYDQLQNQLKFVPPTEGFAGATFTYTATDKGGLVSSPASVRINPPNNTPPTTNNGQTSVPRGATVNVGGGLGGTDPDTPGESRSNISYYQIDSLPTGGTLYLGDPSNGGTVIAVGDRIPPGRIGELFFRADPGATNLTTSFKYRAFDASGSASAGSAAAGVVTLNLLGQAGYIPPTVVSSTTTTPEATDILIRRPDGTTIADGEVTTFTWPGSTPIDGQSFPNLGITGLACLTSELPVTQIFKIQNPNTSESITLTGIELPTGFSSGVNVSGQVIPAGSIFDLPIIFTPGAAGVYSGNLVVYNSATASGKNPYNFPIAAAVCPPGTASTTNTPPGLTFGLNGDNRPCECAIPPALSAFALVEPPVPELPGFQLPDRPNTSNRFLGTPRPDQILATPANDFAHALGAGDYLAGQAGSDDLLGDDGDDTIFGGLEEPAPIGPGKDDDRLEGGKGEDYLNGGPGNDVVFGGQDNDFINGGKDNDVLLGDRGNDNVYGDLSDDTVFGGVGREAPVTDGSDRDFLQGSPGQDVLNGGEGEDTIFGGQDNDFVFGGKNNDLGFGDRGSDTLRGDLGDDTLLGGTGSEAVPDPQGRDALFGLAGDDLLFGNEHNDSLVGNEGDDWIFGGQQDDAVFGGRGDDVLLGDRGSDTLFGGLGGDRPLGREDDNDVIFGNRGPDFINGGQGEDTIFGGKQNDLVFAGKDNDLIFGDQNVDSISGDQGNDTIIVGTVSLLVLDPDGRDVLLGGAGDDWMAGDRGDDLIYGEAGNDSLYGGRENDYLWGGDGQDLVLGDIGDDSLCGDGGNDTLLGGNNDPQREDVLGRDFLLGGAGKDVLFGNKGNDELNGCEGDDTLWGGQGSDSLWGSEDQDLLFGDLGDDSIAGGTGDDTLIGGTGNLNNDETDGRDRLAGGEGNDWLYGNGGGDVLDGNAGDDTLFGGRGDDSVGGGAGNDWLFGDLGDDSLLGGAGNDRFVLGVDLGTETLLDFQRGNDRLVLTGGLAFEGLRFEEITGTPHTRIATGNRVVAIVHNVAPTSFSASDFTT